MADYSDEFASYARDFLNPDLDEEERIAALYAAIQACEGGESEEAAPSSTKKPGGLAIVFGKK